MWLWFVSTKFNLDFTRRWTLGVLKNSSTYKCHIPQNTKYDETIIFWKNESPSFLWHDSDSIENDASNNSSTVGCVFVAAVMFAQSRCPATIGAIHTDTKTLGSDEVRRWDWFRCHDIHVQLHKGWFRRSRFETGAGWWSHTPTFTFSNKKNRLETLTLARGFVVRTLLYSVCMWSLGRRSNAAFTSLPPECSFGIQIPINWNVT
jgi:hypothetical protein